MLQGFSDTCWRNSVNDSSFIINKRAVGFIFDDGTIIVSNPNCRKDNYRFGITNDDALRLKRKIISQRKYTYDSNNYPISFSFNITGRAFREGGVDFFSGTISKPVLIYGKAGIEAYINAGGK